MITGINESKTLAKHLSCEYKCRLDRKTCNSNQWWNNDKCRCECKKIHVCEENYVWNPAACNCENEKYLASIMDDSKIICDEVIESFDEETKTIPTNFDEKKVTCKTQSFYIFFAFLLIATALLIAVSTYCCLKQKISYHFMTQN